MATIKRIALPVAFLRCFFAVGIPYWAVAYRDASLPDTLIAPGLLVVVSIAAVLRLRGLASILKAALAAGGAVPVAVLARVIAETRADPTAHNLWPLEIVIAVLLGLAAALVGALAGSVAARVFAVHRGGGGS
jgi:ABC-type branched-subunit amino acid transport system permease subunit